LNTGFLKARKDSSCPVLQSCLRKAEERISCYIAHHLTAQKRAENRFQVDTTNSNPLKGRQKFSSEEN
jgi:hypothetical protein